MLNEQTIPIYLHFGYLPKIPREVLKQSWFVCGSSNDGVKKKLSALPDPELIQLGVAALKKAFRSTLKEGDNTKMHFLPLSGGLDSRAILGGLLENLKPDKITAITFGIPNTWDYEIGKKVSKYAGISHKKIDLSKIAWDLDNLMNFARESARLIPVFECFLFNQIRCQLDRQGVLWSGYMGDPLAGSHLLNRESGTWEEAVNRFIQRYRYAKSIDFNLDGSFIDQFPSNSFFQNSIISFDEQVDFAFRQESFIKPLVMPVDHDCRSPFLDSHWVNFILNIPRKYRLNQYLYKQVLINAFPALFNLPVKNNYGLPLEAKKWKKIINKSGLILCNQLRKVYPSIIRPSTNYIDLDESLRAKKDLREIALYLTYSFKRRGMGSADIQLLWDNHQRRKKDHADALLLLASLEIFLSVQESA